MTGLPQAEEHGTYPGVSAHNRLGTPVCDPCKAARRAYMADYRARNPEYRTANRALVKAARIAANRLIAAYPAEYARYYAEAKQDIQATRPT